MPSLSRYLYPDYITYREPTISKPSPTINDRFDEKYWSIQKKKYKVIKQVYRVKKDGRLNKNSDLTLDKEKPVVEEQSDSSISKIVPNDDHDSNNVVEQFSSSAGRQDKSNHIGSDRTGLTDLNLRNLVVQKIGPSRPLRSFWINTRRYLRKKQSIQLEGKRMSFLPPRSRKHHRSSYWTSSFIPSMHAPWTAYSRVFNPWFGHNPWLPYYDYQFYALPRSYDLYNRPHWPSQDFVIEHAKQYKAEIVC